jgi:ganglioside-induced differentiation-associated protein 1
MLKLYHHGSSVCAAKVRMAMAEKGLAWEGVYIDILRGDQFDPAYVKLNPKAVVPTLVHDGRVIVESTVICEYLDLIFPEHGLHPSNPFAYARARYWTKAVDEELHPACAVLTFVASHRHTLAKLGKDKLEAFLSATPVMSVTADRQSRKRVLVEQGFAAPGADEKIKLYDNYLRKMEHALADGGWLAGDAFGIADVSVTPYINRLAMLQLDDMWEQGRLPRVADWWQRIQARPTFKPSLLDWIPDGLAADLRQNGARSWPEVARILAIA